MTVLRTIPGYEFDDDAFRVDRDVVWDFLSQHAYWGRWRNRDLIERQIHGAWRIVGAYDTTTGAMVGFGRAMSDGFSSAYLADVFVQHAHQGKGIGTTLVTAMIEDGAGADFRWMLHTADAHDLYAKFGFAVPDHTYLERPSRVGNQPSSGS